MRHTRLRLGVLLLSPLVLLAVPACKQPPPKVLCIMRNPQTGQTATMYKEIPFKVPADYNEQKHIAQWKLEQTGKGFTEEAPAPQ